MNHFRRIASLIQGADEAGMLLQPHGLTGYSGEKLLGALQRIGQYQQDCGHGCYLEIGVFQGLSLLSMASVLHGREAFGIDNFSQFDAEGRNMRLVTERARRLDLQERYTLINEDYEDALEQLSMWLDTRQVGTFFVDGPHDYRSQLACLQLARPHLSPRAVIVVDDCNYPHVRLANRDFLKANPDFKLLFAAYTRCHPANMDDRALEEARLGWWNGVNIMVRDPDDDLEPMWPQTERDRVLYENEHVTHAARYAWLAPEAMSFVQHLLSLRLLGAAAQFRNIVRQARRIDARFGSRFDAMNTYSDTLPASQLNPGAEQERRSQVTAAAPRAARVCTSATSIPPSRRDTDA